MPNSFSCQYMEQPHLSMTPQQQQTRLLLGAWIVAGAITACVRAPRTQLTVFIALMTAVCGLAVYGAYVFRLRRRTSRLR